MHGDSGHVGVSPGYLARVQPTAHLETRAPHSVPDVTCAADRTRRTVECRQDAVASAIDELSTMSDQLSLNRLLEAVEQLAPALVADLAGPLGRARDVHEQDGRQHAVSLALLQP